MVGYHRSVLLEEAIKALHVKKGEWYLDCTLGDGGHTLEILKQGGKVIGMDVDPQALKRAKERLCDLGYFKDQGLRLVQGNFRDLENIISQTESGDQKFASVKSNLAGAIFDLGVSSLQLESPERGFSFGMMGPLDMRMDPTLAVRALDLLNSLSRKELYEIFNQLGEEKYSWRLANALVLAREVKPFTNTLELSKAVEKVVGGKREKIHPATRVFQALRMTVNDELGALKEGLDKVRNEIKKDGYIVVISFHSLEDRIVKNTFREWQFAGFGEVLTKKPIVPTEKEVVDNPRSRSAKMRVFKRS